MYGEGFDITLTEVFILLLVLTIPAQVALVVGSLSGLFLPGMKLLQGAIVGLMVGAVSEFGLIWFLLERVEIDTLYSVPWGITIGVCAVATFGVCWWINRREVKKERLPQIEAPLGCA